MFQANKIFDYSVGIDYKIVEQHGLQELVLPDPESSIIGKTCYEFLYKCDSPCSHCAISKLNHYNKEIYSERFDSFLGEFVGVKTTPIRNNEGKLLQIRKSFLRLPDVWYRPEGVKTKKILEMLKNQFRVLEESKRIYLDAIQNPVIFLNVDESISWMNKSALKCISDLPIQKSGQNNSSGCLNQLSSKNVKGSQQEVEGRNGKWWLCETSTVKDENGITIGYLESMHDITEKKSIQLALEKREKSYRNLYKEAPLAYQSLDINACILDVNDHWLSMLGYSIDEVIGKWFGDFLANEHKQKLEGDFLNFKQKGFVQNNIFKLVTKLGKELIVSLDGTIGQNTLGEFERTYCVFRDVTEDHLTKNALAASEEKYRQVVENANEGICIIQDRKLVFVNARCEEILGYNAAYLSSRTFDHFIHPEDRSLVSNNHNKRLKVGFMPAYNFRIIQEAGICKWIRFSAKTIDFEGRSGVLGFLTDITARKQAEEKLRQNEEKYRLIVENQNDLIAKYTKDYVLSFVTPRYCRVFGLAEEELLGSTFLPRIHPDDKEKVLESLAQLKSGSNTCQHEHRAMTSDGWRWFLWSNKAILDKNGDVAEIIAVGRDITEMKETQIALAENEKKYKLLVENLTDLVCLVGDDGNYVFVNSQYEKRFNQKFSDLIGKNAFAFVHKDDRKQAYKTFRSLKEGESVQSTYRFYSAKRDILWLSCNLQCFIDSDGNRVVEVVSSDITEKVRYEKKIKDSENRYRSMFHKNGSYMVLVDPEDGSIVDINESACRYLGVDYEDRTLLKLRDFILTSDDHFQELKEAILSESKMNFDLKCKLRNGEIRDIEAHSGLVEIEDKFMIYAVLQDVSKRKAAELEIARSNKRLKSILKIAECRADSFQELLNFTLEETLKYTKSLKGSIFVVDQLKGDIVCQAYKLGSDNGANVDRMNLHLSESKFLSELISKAKAQITDCNLTQNGVEGATIKQCMFVPVVERDKTVAFIIVSGRKGGYTSHDLNDFFIMMSNVWYIVEKQRSKEELVVAKDKAEESDRLKSAFLANMSHEIRTPLNAIVGFSNLLGSDEMTIEERRKFSEIVERNSEQLLTLIDDIIDVAKIEGLQLRLNPEMIRVNDAINHVEMNFAELKKKAGKKHITIKAHYPVLDLKCYLDQYRFNQIFFNLVGNSLKFTNEGRIDFGVEQCTDSEFTFFVKDTGIGIEKNKLKTIFGEFSQEDESIAARFGGTGLGLTITKRLVELMGGKIWVESEKGKGAVFYFTIPKGGMHKNEC